MTPSIQAVQASTNSACHSTTCYDSGCGLSLNGLNNLNRPYALLNLEHAESPADKTKRHCDFLLFGIPNRAGTEWVIPIELTRGANKTAQRIVEQLAGGAEVADTLLQGVVNIKLKGVVGQKGLHRHQFDNLRQMRVPFRGKRCRIKILECGDDLVDALM